MYIGLGGLLILILVLWLLGVICGFSFHARRKFSASRSNL
jgi:hypothetical protein